MTHFCYTLEEASQRLNLSEPVLVRLSQYFKVPQHAYEANGYLSFKGDLIFTDQDVAFFRQVREELLSGKNLEQVKSRLRYETTPPPQLSFSNIIQAEAATNKPQPLPQEASTTSTSAQLTAPATPPMVEMMDAAPYQQMAERSFARYKGIQQLGAKDVFKSLMKEVGESSPSRGPEFPVVKPHKRKLEDPNARALASLFQKKNKPAPATLEPAASLEELSVPSENFETDLPQFNPSFEPQWATLPEQNQPTMVDEPEESPAWDVLLSHMSSSNSFGLTDPMRQAAARIKQQAMQRLQQESGRQGA